MTEEVIGLSVPHVARALGLSRSGAYRLAKAGVLPMVRFGKGLVVPRERLAKLLRDACGGSREGPP
jgi:excisionase family DNA binding protein